MVAEKFHIHGVKITEKKTFVSQKIKAVYFFSCPQAKLSPRFLSLSFQPGGTNPFPPTMLFQNLFFPAERGKDYEAEKLTKIKLVTGFDKSHQPRPQCIFSL